MVKNFGNAMPTVLASRLLRSIAKNWGSVSLVANSTTIGAFDIIIQASRRQTELGQRPMCYRYPLLNLPLHSRARKSVEKRNLENIIPVTRYSSSTPTDGIMAVSE